MIIIPLLSYMLSTIENTKFKIEPWESNTIIATSALNLIPITYAFYHNLWYFGITSSGTLFCSILYWYSPTHGWRRTLDLVYAKYSFAVYYLGGSFYIPYGIPYLILNFGGTIIITTYYMTYIFPTQWLKIHIIFHCLVMIMKLYILSCISDNLLSYSIHR